jgi:hypothetical protein
MGYGGGRPRQGETHEVTIELEGEVSEDGFDAFREQLIACLKELAGLKDKDGKSIKLKVRIVQTRTRRK